MKKAFASALLGLFLLHVEDARGAPQETWYPVESLTKKQLNHVAFASDGTGFAVGQDSAVLRYDGNAWYEVPFPEPHLSLVLVGVCGPYDAWVFRRMSNIVYHYIDGRWDTVTLDREFDPQSFDLLRPDLGYVVGLFGILYRFDGRRWERVVGANLTTDRESHLTGVAVLADNDVWLSSQQFLVHFDGTHWTRMPIPAGHNMNPHVQRIRDGVVLTGQPLLLRENDSWRPISARNVSHVTGDHHDLWALFQSSSQIGLVRVLPEEAAPFVHKNAVTHVAQGKAGVWAIGDRGLILHLEPKTLPSFTDHTFDTGAGVQAESQFALYADIDGTGARDLILARPFGRNSFLRGEEGGTFRPMPLVSPTIGELPDALRAAMADIDGDGWIDMILHRDAELDAQTTLVWRNLGGFRFWEAPTGIKPVVADELNGPGNLEVFDFDDDSDLDLYEVRTHTKNGAFVMPNLLHRNDGFGRFTTERLYQHNGGAASQWSNAIVAADFTGDARTDIVSLNAWGDGNSFYLKTEDGSYLDATEGSGLSGDTHLALGAAVGDIDNDGALDILALTSLDFGPSRLYHNDGHGHFHDVTTESGLDRIFASATQAQFADMDLDGDLDLLLGNVRDAGQDIHASGRLRMVVNDGTGHFSDVTVKANIAQETSAFLADDFDDDGDIDMYLVRSGESNRLLVNEPPVHGYVKVHLETAAPNRAALGSRVSLRRNDGSLVGFRETNWQQPIAHFGLGNVQEVDVEVQFPSGRVVRRAGILAKTNVTITEFSLPELWLRDGWFFLRHRWAWADRKRDVISLAASIAFLVGLWRLSKALRTRFIIRRGLTMGLLFALFFVVRLGMMPLEPVSAFARIFPLSTLFVAGFGLLVWDRRTTNRADARFVGPYELLSEIGRGGMGIVYRARDTSQSGRPIVALKIMNRDRVRDASSVRRFVREAEIGAKLAHEGIVAVLASGECRVLDQGAWQSTAYLAMEYIEGTSLAALLAASDRMPLVRLLEILRDAALALHAAHTLGILHRDVKPDNILLSRAGVVKLVDFGIASVVAAPSQTELGFLVGTIAYIPPERVLGRIEDERGDLYSLGVTIFEAIYGRRPFDDHNMSTAQLLRAVVDEPPLQPSTLGVELPMRLTRLIAQLLAKPPEQRPSSAQVVADEIESVLRELHGEFVHFNSLAPPPVEPVPPEGGDPFARETLEIPQAPATGSRPFEQAFDRETLDLPREPLAGASPTGLRDER